MLYNTICYDDVWGRSVYVVVTSLTCNNGGTGGQSHFPLGRLYKVDEWKTIKQIYVVIYFKGMWWIPEDRV